MSKKNRYICWFDEISKDDLPLVGGKNASLGEMIGHLAEVNVKVPSGFALTTDAYRMLLEKQDLEQFIFSELERYHRGQQNLSETGRNIRLRFKAAALPDELRGGLQHAAEVIDLETANHLIDQIREHNEPLAEALAELVKNYSFDTLQELCIH